MDNVFTSALMAYPIQRNVYRCSKYTLQLFIPAVEMVYYTNRYQVSPNAILFLSPPWKPGDVNDGNNKSFRINRVNRRRLLRTIETALDWFKTIEDLFVVKDGTLYFNTDYNNLKSVYAPKYYENPQQGMKIVPTTIEVGNGVMNEGVILYINRLENHILLLKDELQELYDLLVDFDFAAETLVTYQALEMAIRTNSTVSYEKWKEKFRN